MRERTAEERETIRRRLTVLRCPPHIIDAVVDAPVPSRTLSMVNRLAVVTTVMMLVFAPLILFLGLFRQIIEDRQEKLAIIIGGILYSNDVVLFFTLFFMCGMFLSPQVAGFFQSLVSNSETAQLGLVGDSVIQYYSKMGGERSFTARVTRALLGRADENESIGDFIRKRVFLFRRSIYLFSVSVVIVAALAILASISNFTTYSIGGFERKRMFPLQEEMRSWETSETLSLGCIGPHRRDSPVLIYTVEFPDGASERLGKARAVSGDFLDALEIIDAEFRRLGIPAKRALNSNGAPLLSRACFAHFAAKSGPGGEARLRRLLRVGELPGDRG